VCLPCPSSSGAFLQCLYRVDLPWFVQAVVTSLPSLDAGFGKDLFLRWASNPLNLVRAPLFVPFFSVPCALPRIVLLCATQTRVLACTFPGRWCTYWALCSSVCRDGAHVTE
jgi:hypothetical protein